MPDATEDEIVTAQRALLDDCTARFRQLRHSISLFGTSVRDFFQTHPQLTTGPRPALHSVRYRVKGEDSLHGKLLRKCIERKAVIEPDALLLELTDLAGVRVLHLHGTQFPEIHRAILAHEEGGQWLLHEPPKAYTWDPESKAFFDGLEIDTRLKESSYTSVHYVLRPNKDNPICCEVQVRTLFEETWGEIEHMLNYPVKTRSLACREQLKVLAKLTGAGIRLVDAIVRSHEEWESQQGGDAREHSDSSRLPEASPHS